jgi:hypothetical protein
MHRPGEKCRDIAERFAAIIGTDLDDETPSWISGPMEAGCRSVKKLRLALSEGYGLYRLLRQD